MSDNVDRVLKVFAVYESGAGDVLLANHFVYVAQRKGWDIPALQRGIEEAFALDFIEKADLGWRLTSCGFDKATDMNLSIA